MPWDGQKIKLRAKERSISLQDLANNIGVSRQALNLWANGQIPRGEHLIKLCNTLAVEPSFFIPTNDQELVSIPQHRTIRNQPLTENERQASRTLAEQYVPLFKCVTTPAILKVIRVNERNEDQAKKIANQLRSFLNLDNSKPVDFADALKLMNDLGIYTIFRTFPKEIEKKIYALYCKICNQRVVLINANISSIDLIFHLLHEAVHAVRDEIVNDQTEEAEERFCDCIASYTQFSAEYIEKIKSKLEYFDSTKEADKIVRFLKDTAIENNHAIYGLYKRLVEEKLPKLKDENGIFGADANLRKHNFHKLNDILFKENDAREYVALMKSFAPLFTDAISQQIGTATSRKIGEWLGLDNALDANAVIEELQRG